MRVLDVLTNKKEIRPPHTAKEVHARARLETWYRDVSIAMPSDQQLLR